MRGRLALTVVLLVLAGCSATPERTAPPDGLSAEVMQYRGQRLTRDIAIAIDNGTDDQVDLTAMRLESNRWPESFEWKGDEGVGPGFGTGIDVDPPTGTCPEGKALAVTADLTYRYAGEDRRSTLPVQDPYGVLRDLVDGDCGRQAFEEATGLTVGEPRISGDTWTADLDLTPRVGSAGVTLLGFAPTLRFAFGPRTPVEVALPLDRRHRLRLDVVMGRCDPHVVAEDKVGTRFGVRVRTAEVEHAWFTLDLDPETRDSLERFYAERCRP